MRNQAVTGLPDTYYRMRVSEHPYRVGSNVGRYCGSWGR